MKIIEIAFSAYTVTDIPRAKAFYEGVLGLKSSKDYAMENGSHWIEYDIGPGTLGIGKFADGKPSPDGYTVALEVENFDEAVAALKNAGTPIKMGPFETPVCHMVMVSDPDNNTVIIHKRKPGHD